MASISGMNRKNKSVMKALLFAVLMFTSGLFTGMAAVQNHYSRAFCFAPGQQGYFSWDKDSCDEGFFWEKRDSGGFCWFKCKTDSDCDFSLRCNTLSYVVDVSLPINTCVTPLP